MYKFKRGDGIITTAVIQGGNKAGADCSIPIGTFGVVAQAFSDGADGQNIALDFNGRAGFDKAIAKGSDVRLGELFSHEDKSTYIVPTMSPTEFIDGGYLLEVNRRVLHPLGVAMGFSCAEDGSVLSIYFEDHREDPEGMVYAKEVIEDPAILAKAENIRKEWLNYLDARMELVGYYVGSNGVQSIPLFRE